ncbi:hypothetical protein K32_11110 [Kaistia sp. 32K]|uniref:hypothetical protein n=1 Tax=Kaistia sp. 32K TaxID=2795690 RepID=UPI00191537F7|nr:hypothetical protein [Kaistia sp. 32K]BCP52494.1 hypothetical protein K32_11110 [Kaistia sp. 32K]
MMDGASRISGIAVAGALLFAVSGAAFAGEVADKAAAAETLLQAGKAADAHTALDQAVDAFWKSAPLTLKNARFVNEAKGFGDYVEHQGSSFAPSSTLQVYVEPQGFGWQEVDGGYKIAFASDVEIRNAGGQILTKSAAPALLEKTSRNKNREFQVTVGFQLPALKPGNYVLVLTVTDQATGHSAPVELPFTISG